jgi:hypothetical protein
MKKSVIFIILFVVLASMVAAASVQQLRRAAPAPQTGNETATTTISAATSTIDTFEKCVAAGKEVTGVKPSRICRVSDDLAYLEIETCTAPGGQSMNMFEAQQIFDRSQCGLEGSAKEEHWCDEKAGTLFIGILTYRKGCDPVCAIDVATKKAFVDWRCAAALSP